MKIQLERKLSSCPNKLVCTVCYQWFEAGKIRTLLYNNKGLLQGDLCPECLKLSASGIRTKLRERASLLLQNPKLNDPYHASARDRALELLQAAQEDLKQPTLFDWWVKKLEIFSEESQELEAQRVGNSDFYLAERSRLQKMLEDDRE